jgi:lycopene cyclase domain-containing protein
LGITIGWVPLEEYTFFLLQPLMTGLWVLYLNRHLPAAAAVTHRHRLQILVTLGIGLIWLGALSILVGGWQPANYMTLILVWALPPIALQTAFGADILWHERQRVLLGLLPAVIYLSLADALAIGSGTWTINPDRSLEIYLGSVLPIEEFVFFLVTNVLIVFAMVLLLSRHSHARLNSKISRSLRLPALQNNRPTVPSRR